MPGMVRNSRARGNLPGPGASLTSLQKSPGGQITGFPSWFYVRHRSCRHRTRSPVSCVAASSSHLTVLLSWTFRPSHIAMPVPSPPLDGVGVDVRGRAMCAGIGGHQTGDTHNSMSSEHNPDGQLLSKIKTITKIVNTT